MTEEYAPPQHVIESWKKQCNCCPECSPHPCDGVMAGGMCDSLECECGDDYEDYEEPEEECYMTPDGYCMAAGSEHCDWDCPNNRGS